MTKPYSWLTIVFIVVLTLGVVAGIAGGAYYLGQRSAKQPGLPSISGTEPTLAPSSSAQVSPPVSVQSPLFSGSVQKITKDLELFALSDADIQNDVASQIVYYQAGVFTRGPLAGYTRVLAIRPSEGPGPSLQFLLATKDYVTYVLDDPEQKTVNYPATDWENPYSFLNKNKVSQIATFETDHPQTLAIAKPYGLIREDVPLIESAKTGQKDKNGYDIYLDAPITKFDSAESLASPDKRLTLHAGTSEWGTGEGYTASEKKLLEIRKQYLHNTTYVFGSDSTGLTYAYVLAPQKDIDAYISALPAYNTKLITYKTQYAEAQKNKSVQDIPYPQSSPFPGMRVTRASDSLPSDYYENYSTAFPGACGGSTITDIVSNLKDSDLTQVASSSPFALYVPVNNNHPLYEVQYQAKTGVDDEGYKMSNGGKSKPTLDQYVAKHPLLFFKDSWGRWGVMGEYDIQLMGGCGKPVVYLYPEKPTDVRLSFVTSMGLDTQIPSYHGGWYVNAHPDGSLTDLQPQFTNCADIDNGKFGSEYAGTACRTNTYPYIYWSGRSETNPYPHVEGGWVVAQSELRSFMRSKLSDMGLTERESADMMAYWIPKMQDKNAPYYRVSFIQTKDMNTFIPMHISPQPDSVLRVFLDWSPLETKPQKALMPQKLEKIERRGFVYVEWGGLKF